MCRVNKYSIVCEKVRGYNADYIDKTIRSSSDVAEFIIRTLKSDRFPTERFMVFVLDTKLRILSFSDEIAIGTVDSAPVDPKEIFRFVLATPKAAAAIVAHQHPSGDPTPSIEDLAVTERLVTAGEILGVKLLDHLIIGDGCWTSLRSEGFIQ